MNNTKISTYDEYIKENSGYLDVDEISAETTLEEIQNMMKKIIGKNIICNIHKNLGGRELKLKVQNTNYDMYCDTENHRRFKIKINNIIIDPNIDIKILGKRIISSTDPYGEEEWED